MHCFLNQSSLIFSTRTPGGPGNAKKRLTKEDTDDDLTRDMDDPLPETNIQEVQLSKQCQWSQIVKVFRPAKNFS
jgi:hypothetical protein